jgi:uncharacterized membrane protein
MSPQQSQTEVQCAYHLVMLAFNGVATAQDLVTAVKIDCALDQCEVEAEAVITRDGEGHIVVHERGSAGVGATLGMVTAVIIGFVTGPILLPVMMAVGGVAGGVAGHFAGKTLPTTDLRDVGEMLPPDSSAYLAIVDSEHADSLIAAFAEKTPTILDVAVETEICSAIREAVTHRVMRV